VTRLEAARYGFWFPVDMRFFSSPECPDRLWDHPACYSKGMGILHSRMSRQAVGPPSLLFKGYGNSSLGAKWLRHGDDHSSPFSGQGVNEWSCTSAPPLFLPGMNKKTFINTGFYIGRL